MNPKYLWLVLLVCVGLLSAVYSGTLFDQQVQESAYAGDLATTGTTTGETPPPPPDYDAMRAEIRLLRDKIQRARRNHCRLPMHFRRAVRDIPDDRLDEALITHRQRLTYERNRRHLCPDRYWRGLGVRLAQHVWHWRQNWESRCIRSHEGGYSTNTGNGYYGAWQMDWNFQTAYDLNIRGTHTSYSGRWGVASNWPDWAQDATAHRGYHARNGWQPWPLSAQKCGLPWYPDRIA